MKELLQVLMLTTPGWQVTFSHIPPILTPQTKILTCKYKTSDWHTQTHSSCTAHDNPPHPTYHHNGTPHHTAPYSVYNVHYHTETPTPSNSSAYTPSHPIHPHSHYRSRTATAPGCTCCCRTWNTSVHTCASLVPGTWAARLHRQHNRDHHRIASSWGCNGPWRSSGIGLWDKCVTYSSLLRRNCPRNRCPCRTSRRRGCICRCCIWIGLGGRLREGSSVRLHLGHMEIVQIIGFCCCSSNFYQITERKYNFFLDKILCIVKL